MRAVHDPRRERIRARVNADRRDVNAAGATEQVEQAQQEQVEQAPEVESEQSPPHDGEITRYEVRDRGGEIIASHCRRGSGRTKKVWWESGGPPADGPTGSGTSARR